VVVTLGTTAAAAKPVANSSDRNERFNGDPFVVGGCQAVPKVTVPAARDKSLDWGTNRSATG
jgi:hypothetical protein